MSIRAYSFKPPPRTSAGNYDLDAFVVEEDDRGSLDFRFELGSGLGIYWALPAAPNYCLRLLHVDGAAYTVDEPELIDDPWACQLPQLRWGGLSTPLTGGRTLLSVSIEVTPHSYRCVLELDTEARVLSWKSALASEEASDPARR